MYGCGSDLRFEREHIRELIEPPFYSQPPPYMVIPRFYIFSEPPGFGKTFLTMSFQ